MSALSHIRDYLKEHFAGHDTETLMQHFETAIEAKVEESIADLKQEIAELRNDLTPKPQPVQSLPEGFQTAPGAVTWVDSGGKVIPPIAQPDAKVEAQSSDAATDGSAA